MFQAKSLLIVCQGNICRSPMAEGYLSHHLKNKHSDIQVFSAGLQAVVGYPAEIHAKTVMEKHGIDISQHRAKQITESMIRSADIILVMLYAHLNTLTRRYLIAKGKTFLLGHWQDMEVEDPYMQSYEVFEKIYQKIIIASQEWIKRILDVKNI